MNLRRIIIMLALATGYIFLLMIVSTVLAALLFNPPIIQEPLGSWFHGVLEILGDGEWLLWAGTFGLIVAATQFVFMIPVKWLRPPRAERGTSLKLSILLAGLVASILVVAMLFALAELAASLATGQFTSSPWSSSGDMLDHGLIWALLAVALFGSWAIWSFILFVFSRELWADRLLGRIVHVLLAGTIVEMILILPIDILVRRRADCYCATGTFWSLCLAGTALLWLAGPGAWLALFSPRHRAVRERYCGKCGQPKGPTPGECCPECGHAGIHREPAD